MNAPATTAPAPLLYSFADTLRLLGLKSRTSIYTLVADGKLDMRKVLGKSVITAASLHAFAESLPTA